MLFWQIAIGLIIYLCSGWKDNKAKETLEKGSLWFRGDCKQVWAGNETMTEEIATSNDLILSCQYMGSIRKRDGKFVQDTYKASFQTFGLFIKLSLGTFSVIAAKIKSLCFLERLQGFKNIVAYSSLKWFCNIPGTFIMQLGSVKCKLRSVLEVILEMLAIAVGLQLSCNPVDFFENIRRIRACGKVSSCCHIVWF